MFAVVRIKGTVGLNREIKDTLNMLRLDAPHTCAIVPKIPSYQGMVEKVKDYVTYGEVEKGMIVEILKKRLRHKDESKVDEESFKKITNFKSYEEFAEDLLSGKVKLSDFKKLSPIIKLAPPSKGFKSIKSHYPKGDLGYRGKDVQLLLEKMV